MWFFYAVLSAVSFTALWVLARMSREMPSNVVTSLQAAAGPFILWYIARDIDFPWSEIVWQWYLIFPFLLLPFALWALTASVHRTEVTVVKPLTAVSSICTLMTAWLFFQEEISLHGALGICIITIGLLVLYQGNFTAWKKSGPWLALIGSILIGVNAAVLAGVMNIFPHVLALTGFVMSAIFFVNGIAAGTSWLRIEWSGKNALITIGMILANIAQNIFTLVAFLYGPAAYVIAVKRTSLLLTALIGYLFLHERDQSLSKLFFASLIVIVGVIALALT